jgi:hypothetical protein
MKQVSIAIPDDEIDWAQSRVAAGEFASIDAYFSDLAQRDRASAEEMGWLQAEIDKGIASGLDARTPKQIFADVRTKYFMRDG